MGNLKGRDKLTVYDPDDTARTTLKEQLLHDASMGNLKGPKKLTVHDPNDIARTTLKEQLIHDSSLANLKGPAKLTVYDPNNVARTTLKEQLIHDSTVVNLTGPVQLYVYDPEVVARTTARQTLSHIDNNINLMGAKKNAVYCTDPAKSTLTETLIDLDRFGNSDRYQAGDAYDFVEFEARLTQKQFLSDNDYYGSAVRDEGSGYTTNEYEARPTQKAELSDNDFYGVATANTDKKPLVKEDVENMTMRLNKEEVIIGRAPTQNGNKTYTSVSETPDISHKKNECDLNKVRDTPNTERIYNEIPSIQEVSITKDKKDYRQYDCERLDIAMIKARMDNPLNIDVTKSI